MNNLQVVTQSAVDRIRRIASEWLVSADAGSAAALNKIVAVLLEPSAIVVMPSTIKLAADRVSSVYLAGPMTGYEDHNFPAFNACAAKLRGRFAYVVNPAEHGIVDGAEWGDYLRYDIVRLADCACIALLPGWSKSRGAQLEVHIAQKLSMPILLMEGAEAVPEVVEPSDSIEQDAAEWRSQAAHDVLAERRRQVEVYGYTPESDDRYSSGQMSIAAACYLVDSDAYPNPGQQPPDWPWAADFWNPTDYRRDLVRAAALVLAEIERIDRAAAKVPTELYSEADEARMDVVGQNGNDGAAYAELADAAIQNGGKLVDELPDWQPRLDPEDDEACEAAFFNEYHKIPALISRIEWDARWKQGMAPPQLRAKGWTEWHAAGGLAQPEKVTAVMLRDGDTIVAGADKILAAATLVWSPMPGSIRHRDIIAYLAATPSNSATQA